MTTYSKGTTYTKRKERDLRWEYGNQGRREHLGRELGKSQKFFSLIFCNSKPSFNVRETDRSHLLNGTAVPWSLKINRECYISKGELENLEEAQYPHYQFWSALPMWYTTFNAIGKCLGTVVLFSLCTNTIFHCNNFNFLWKKATVLTNLQPEKGCSSLE